MSDHTHARKLHHKTQQPTGETREQGKGIWSKGRAAGKGIWSKGRAAGKILEKGFWCKGRAATDSARLPSPSPPAHARHFSLSNIIKGIGGCAE